ncbi:hypothetical protein E2K80_04970 [Rhodophyticola sp. CCM32]|uniref:hypothetical protein n=1 Tax=Rhodophyticola sp. CCM32 TaxID=2916397 RepID=UPI00107FD167|nr:hypothetical protein [Rhodophyticola sp. CCM32]QBY00169.1 hypothetical protein E2K80_04970 [Rhodophyticola sp. CCM32]
MRVFRALSFCILVTACNYGGTGGALTSHDLGMSGVYSRQVLISDDMHHVLMGHVAIVTRNEDGETEAGLIIHQRRDGVHRLHYRAAWRDGVELPYTSLSHRDNGCTHGHCLDNAVGMIALSSEMMRHAAVHGFRAHLSGWSGTIDIDAPPDLFVEALHRAADM